MTNPYKTIVKIHKQYDDALLQVVEFTVDVQSEEEALDKATDWIVKNFPEEARNGIHCEIEYHEIGEDNESRE